MKTIARWLADSPFFARARRLAEKNRADWNLSLGRVDNLLVSSYLWLTDYADSSASWTQERVIASERQYGSGLGGVSREEFFAKEMRKPFWDANAAGQYLNGFVRLWRLLESLGVRPPARLLELGCGSGWMAEFFANAGYHVVASTLVEADAAAVERRTAALRAKGVTSELVFQLCAMENCDAVVPLESIDAVYVHQALHHAHDRPAALGAAFRVLKSGGWLVIADEPNVLHGLLGYRMAKMSGTREVGISRREIIRALRAIGYREIRVFAPRINDRWRPHWMAARK